jgi:hypothetical protein
MSNAMLIETVRVARDYLKSELEKYESWENICVNESIITKLVDNAKGWVKLRDQGVGQTTLLKFLGRNWKQWKIY